MPIDTSRKPVKIVMGGYPLKRGWSNMFKTKKSRPDVTGGDKTYSSMEVSRIAQVSLRQLQPHRSVNPRQHHHRHRRQLINQHSVPLPHPMCAVAIS